MTNQDKTTIFQGLTLYEASVKRMQTAKPQFSAVFETELAQIQHARDSVNKTPIDK